MSSGLIEQRIAEKARHRAAILAAARALVDEQGGPVFTVDEIAARAGVARRTIFNHFASVDEILLTACEETLSVVIDDFLAHMSNLPTGDGSRASMFQELVAGIRATDLPSAIVTIVRLVGIPGEPGSRAAVLVQTAFARVTEQLIDEVTRRHHDADPLAAELLVSSLMNGVVVIATHWIKDNDSVLDDATRDSWNSILSRLINGIRDGYAPTR